MITNLFRYSSSETGEDYVIESSTFVPLKWRNKSLDKSGVLDIQLTILFETASDKLIGKKLEY